MNEGRSATCLLLTAGQHGGRARRRLLRWNSAEAAAEGGRGHPCLWLLQRRAARWRNGDASEDAAGKRFWAAAALTECGWRAIAVPPSSACLPVHGFGAGAAFVGAGSHTAMLACAATARQPILHSARRGTALVVAKAPSGTILRAGKASDAGALSSLVLKEKLNPIGANVVDYAFHIIRGLNALLDTDTVAGSLVARIALRTHALMQMCYAVIDCLRVHAVRTHG